MQSDPSLCKFENMQFKEYFISQFLCFLMCFTEGGYQLLYDRVCPIELSVIDDEVIERVGHAVTSTEEMQVKILIKVSKSESISL